MIKIAGMWERTWNAPLMEVNVWELLAREFLVDQFYMVPVSGILNQYLSEKQTMCDVIEENKDLTVIFLHENGDVALDDFVHPENALYLFGKSGVNLNSLLREGLDISLKIETPRDSGLMQGIHTASIVLYDRFKKSWQ
jgi:hypothetical protein